MNLHALFALVFLSAPLAAQGRTLTLGKAIPIGSATELTRVSAAALGPGTLIAVAQPQDNSVLLFDITRPDKPVATAGRKGDGPGEFSSIGDMGWIGDTLWVSDGGRPRVERFGRDGKQIASQTFHPPVAPPPGRYGAPFAVMQGGTVGYYPGVVALAGPPGKPRDTSTPFPILMAHGQPAKLDTITTFRALEGILTVRGDRGGMSAGSQPFTQRQLAHSGANGTRLLIVTEPVDNAPDGKLTVQLFDQSGKRVVNKQLALRRLPVTDAEWDSVVTRRTTTYAEDFTSEAKARAALKSALVRPAFHPFVTAAFVGQDGTIWLRQERQQNGVATWLVLTKTGDPYGVVKVPSGMRIVDGKISGMIAVVTDADGVDQLAWIPLVRR